MVLQIIEGEPMRWSIHHVNICSPNVARTRHFLSELVGLPEGSWTYPPDEQMGEVGHNADSIAYYGTDNRGMIDAIASSNWTNPSFASLLTGTQVSTHGVTG